MYADPPARISDRVAAVERNWAGNHAYAARAVHRPETIEELQELIAAAPRIRVLGTRHSFHGLPDSEELVSLERLPAAVEADPGAGTVRCSGATTYGALAAALAPHRLALANLASLPHISVAGAAQTATHGSGDRNGNLATAVAALELVTGDGERRTVRRGDPGFEGHVVALGALGAVVRIELDAEPDYDVRQVVFEGLAWAALLEHLDEVFAAAYAVSVFTRWGEAVDQVWLKQRGDDTRDELFGARRATEDRHPILGNDPVNATPQLGRPGPWADRLPHFRLDFTPSNGEELQSEYHVPRRHAAAAIEALRAAGPGIRAPLLVSELRTVAADGLWLSPQHAGPTLGIHFTWAREPEAVGRAIDVVEAALAPFEPRPHWGKLFHTDRDQLAARFPRLPDFRSLAALLDPGGTFRNAWLEERVL
jgi:xylitol oxidase